MTKDELISIDRLFIDLLKGNRNERLIFKIDRILDRELKLKAIEDSFTFNGINK